MPKKVQMSGNEAVANALRQINPDVFPMFPITPSTEIPQYFANYVSNGLVDTEFITVESEHSSMSAAIGASAAGARALTATSSAGLAFMWEVLGVAASHRVPVVLAAVCRALTGPLNINCDHSDTMGARDSGWIQLYAETNQEAYDNMVMAYRIAEHKDVMLPIMICQDGFITSHAVMNMELLDDDVVKNFVGEYEPEDYLLNPNETYAVGPYAITDYYMESRKAQAHAMENAKQVIKDIAEEFEKISGRKYGLIEEYRMEDAEYAVVIIGSAAGTTKEAIDHMRENGEKVGLIKVRSFRPFPGEEIAASLKKCKAVAIMDRSESFSTNGGPLGAETMQAMYTARCTALTIDIMYGIGGRDVTVDDMINVYDTLKDIAVTGETGDVYRYMGLRDKEAK
ncbi:pyruvate flavodoxin/ferredoxin oxidoreductase thiamine diP-binding domain protein [Eubacterium sp. AF19-12LB]|jgi:pyruvate ferredoxin oxidoreductase alpha subunit|uniref:pyruvate flavodoxin/ferredoxin oxidoreductase thiamine diP-binding domain protein n=1 Tax=Eubacterium TaxID=1730 RepID=UPI0003414360|nr:pyruvate flavodoxin/ferredoxin oxidoreductase thiamine diP-binding domain protein [Eubacterium sp. AF19-12LB]RHR35115.1 pyruvate ferredoxin oxidoreductase [Eubacterium sp. AF19-12LB]CDA28489.1 pyruvate flavodoxin/ferredoxin oxidoreductase thiamine diP-binding domain protein [Eubacterium sp. CAG:156]